MTTIQKWGNSLAVRIPNHFAKELGIDTGTKVDIQKLDKKIIIQAVKEKPTLEELLAQTKGKTNPHLDYGFGSPEGKEIL